MNKNKAVVQNKSWYYTLVSSGLIMIPALAFAVSADLPHIPLFCLIGIFLSLASRRAIPYSDRTVIYTLVVAIVAAVMFDLVFPMKDNRLGYISIFFYPNILVPFLLYIAVGVTLFESSPRGLGVVAASSLVCLMFGGDVINNNLAGERLPFTASIIRNINYFYSAAVAVEMALLLAGLFWCLGRGSGVTVSATLQRRRFLLRLACVLLLPVAAGTMLGLYMRYDGAVRAVENYLLRVGVKRFMPGPGRVQFDKRVDLTFTMTADMVKNQEEIVLRVKSASPPGYLRGRSYVKYRDGIWNGGNESVVAFKTRKYEGMLAYTTFYLGESPDAGKVRMDIFPQNRFASEMLLIPGNCVKIDAIADRIEADTDGAVGVKEWVRDGGYSCFSVNADQESTWPLPSGVISADYLQVPDEIKPALDKFNREALVSRRHPGNEKITDQEAIARLTAFIHANFKYSLDWKFEGKGDPVVFFLTKYRHAHCELFASATTLLLRRHGIPARYVTGFICDEQHPSGAYYVSRLGNAHAWVEAWDRQQKRWLLVEPTPASGVPNFRHQWSGLDPWKDRLSHIFQETMAMLRRGVVATAILAVFSGIWGMLTELVMNPWRAGLMTLALAGIFWWWYRRRKRRRGKNADLERGRKEVQRHYLLLEKQLASHCGLNRNDGETVTEFLERCSAVTELPPEWRELLADYRKLRYSASVPAESEIKRWAKRAKNSKYWRKR